MFAVIDENGLICWLCEIESRRLLVSLKSGSVDSRPRSLENPIATDPLN